MLLLEIYQICLSCLENEKKQSYSKPEKCKSVNLSTVSQEWEWLRRDGARQIENLINERWMEIGGKETWRGGGSAKEMSYTVLTSKILLHHLFEWYRFKPVRKWKHSPNQPLCISPEMYQPIPVLFPTQNIILKRKSAWMWSPWNRARD